MLACVGGVGCGDACGGCVPGRGLFARRWAAVASRGAEGRAWLREGGRRCDGVPAAAGGPAVLGRGCERVACEGMWGRRRALAVASGAVFEPGRCGSCCEGSAARGSRCGTWRGGGVGGGPGHLCDESVVSRRFVPGVACRCVGGGAVAGLGISSAFGFASRLLKLLSVAGFSPCGGHRMYCGATERCWFSSRRFSSLFHRVRPRVPWGCRGAPLWCSPLPFRSVIEGLDRGVFSELGLSTPINYGAKVLVKLLIVQMKTCFSSFGGRFLTFETENAPIFGLRRGKNWHFVCRRLVRISLKT